MNNRDHIDKLVEDTINSIDGIKRAEARPYLFTRINARIGNHESSDGFWSRASWILSRPGIAISGILIILIMNIVIILDNTNTGYDNAQNLSTAKDEFAMTQLSLYDTENQEP